MPVMPRIHAPDGRHGLSRARSIAHVFSIHSFDCAMHRESPGEQRSRPIARSSMPFPASPSNQSAQPCTPPLQRVPWIVPGGRFGSCRLRGDRPFLLLRVRYPRIPQLLSCGRSLHPAPLRFRRAPPACRGFGSCSSCIPFRHVAISALSVLYCHFPEPPLGQTRVTEPGCARGTLLWTALSRETRASVTCRQN